MQKKFRQPYVKLNYNYNYKLNFTLLVAHNS